MVVVGVLVTWMALELLTIEIDGSLKNSRIPRATIHEFRERNAKFTIVHLN